MPSPRAIDQSDLFEPLTQLISLLLGGGDPLRLAPFIVEQTAEVYRADISTLFRVEDGDRLVLAHGVAWLDEQRALPMHLAYKLKWNPSEKDLEGCGVTAAVAMLNEEVKIDSYQKLLENKHHTGLWDPWVYPHGVNDQRTGFGCLYAVPLRLSETGEPHHDVAGVFKIERRRGQSTFTKDECQDFDDIADQLSQLLQKSRVLEQTVDEHVREMLSERYARKFKRYQPVFDRCINLLQREYSDKNTLKIAEDLLEEHAKPASEWIKRVKAKVQHNRKAVLHDDETVYSVVRALPTNTSAQQISGRERATRLSLVHPKPSGIPELLNQVESGFAALTVAEESKRAALDNIQHWLEASEYREYYEQLKWLIAQERWAVLLDSFHRVLPSGTGGRRGPVGIGTNRFNPHTLKSFVHGHARYLLERYHKNVSVVVAYDVREFHDLRGVYNPRLDPLRGISSRRFAELAARVYAANGIRVYMPDPEHYISTPELSFTIRKLEAQGGINISASHNHPDDNGGKFYNAHGSQDAPPHDEEIGFLVAEVERKPVPMLSPDEARAEDLLRPIPGDRHGEYVSLNVEQSLWSDARQARIVFTPLHGTGDTSVGDVLRKAGFKLELVPEESTPDGAFTNIPFRAPNPEVPDSMRRATELARRLGAQLVLACDPDADRIGVCSATGDGNFKFLTGNEIAVLVTHFKLQSLKEQRRLLPDSLVIKTEVTTEMLRAIADDFGATLIGDLLVGFKYHGKVLEQREETGLKNFIIGVEESHGVLVTPELRDKDAAGAAILLGELASKQLMQGRTVTDYLDDLYLKYGYHANLVTSMVMTGAEGLANIQAIQAGLRSHPPSSIAAWKVAETLDHQLESGIHGRLQSTTDLAARDVLVFRLANDARIIIRPSGTEPKNKTYIEVKASPLGTDADRKALDRQKAECNRIAQEIADDFARKALAIIGVDLPGYALRISGLVPLDKRIDFGKVFLPGLEAQVKDLRDATITREDVSRWIDRHLRTYGDDARSLVAEAMKLYLTEERAKAGRDLPRLENLDAMEAIFFGCS